MPDQTSDRRGFTCPPDECFANRHMTGAEYKMYSVMCAFAVAGRKSRGHKDLICTASVLPTLCNAMPCSRNGAAKLINALHKKGWLILRSGQVRQDDGTLSPNIWEMVEHPAFAAKHPGSCPPYPYAPNYETAQAHGLEYGDKFETGAMPWNFWKNHRIVVPGGQVVAEVVGQWWSGLTEEERQAHIEHLNNDPPSVVEFNLVLTGAKKPTAPTTVGTVNDPTVPITVDTAPCPQLEQHRAHSCDITVPTTVDRSLIQGNTHTPTTTLPGGGGSDLEKTFDEGKSDDHPSNTSLPNNHTGPATGDMVLRLKRIFQEVHGRVPRDPSKEQVKPLGALADTHGDNLWRTWKAFVTEACRPDTHSPYGSFVRDFSLYHQPIVRKPKAIPSLWDSQIPTSKGPAV